MNGRKILLWCLVAFAIGSVLAESASACNRCGLFGRRCRFAHVAVVDQFAVTPYAAAPSVLTIQNNYNAPNGAAAFLAPQGQTVYGLAQAAQPYTLSPDAVLRQAAELTKGAQSLAQQGLNGYNQTASLALTLSASQPAIQAAAITAPQQLNAGRSVSQSIKLTQGANGQWTVDVSGGEGDGAPTQPAAPPAQSAGDSPQPSADLPQGPSLVAKHCASCHGKDNPAPAGKLYFDAGLSLDPITAMRAMRSVNAHKMPKKVELPDDVRCAINKEIESLTVIQ